MFKELSIIFVSYNTKTLLEDCIASLIREIGDLDHEIIVVDNHSKDSTQEMIRNAFPEVLLLCNDENAGFSKACNQGFQVSCGRHLLFLNTDTIILGSAVQNMLRYLKSHPEAGVVGPKILNKDYQPTRSYMRFLDAKKLFWGTHFLRHIIDVEKHRIHYAVYDFNACKSVPWVSGACLMIKRDVFSAVGCFDENYFFYFEDMDICLQVHKAGYDVVYLPEAEIVHLFGGSTSKSSKWINKNYKNSFLYYFRKNTNLFSAVLALLYIRIMPHIK